MHFRKHHPIVLASSSERRIELLKKIGVNPSIVVSPKINEDTLKSEKPYSYVKRMALSKALEVKKNYHDNSAFILSADTIVLKGLRYIHKPKNVQDAKEKLELLRGGSHKVLTSFCIITPNQNVILKVVKTTIKIKNFTKQDLDWYLSTNEWEGKSGAYAIQGIFEVFVKKINGSVSSVIGLPLLEVNNALQGNGFFIYN